MAPPSGSSRVALIEQLLREGRQFGFFQTARLLQLDARARGISEHGIQFRPRLSLAFPDADIHDVVRLPAVNGKSGDSTEQPQAVQVTVNFGGLYGVDSPLPTFYTEELITERREDRHATRGLLDLLHRVLYPLLYQAWHKPRLQLRINEEKDLRALQYLHAFAGIQHQSQHSLQRRADMLRYAGLLAQRPKSALGLQCLLSDAMAPAKVQIRPCVPSHSTIPADQRCQLGVQACSLGEDSVLGEQVHERSSHLDIHLRDLEVPHFESLLPGQEEHARLCTLIQLYLDSPLVVTVSLHPKAAQMQTTQLGQGVWSCLGLGTWLAPSSKQPCPPARFSLDTALLGVSPAPQ